MFIQLIYLLEIKSIQAIIESLILVTYLSNILKIWSLENQWIV